MLQQVHLALQQSYQLPSKDVWPEERERVLAAVVHEFGSSWKLVADVTNSSMQLEGKHLTDTSAKNHFRDMLVRSSVPLRFGTSLPVQQCRQMLY